MKTPHKHAALIKAWAEGAEIENRSHGTCKWLAGTPGWSMYCEYRIKPEPNDVTEYRHVVRDDVTEYRSVVRDDYDNTQPANLKLIFDGETGALKEAEVIA